MCGMDIRPATSGDIEALLSLYSEFHTSQVAHVPDRLREPADRDDDAIRTTLRMLLATEDAVLFVAGDGPQVVGLAEVYLKRDEENPWRVRHNYAYLQSLMVTAAYRRSGIGMRLLAAAEVWARERGAAELRLDAWEYPGGPVAFYEARGYRTLRRTLARPL